MITKPSSAYRTGTKVYATEDVHGLISRSERGILAYKNECGCIVTAGVRALNVQFSSGLLLCTYDMVALQPAGYFAKQEQLL